jgi:hypothetical protein
VGKVKEHVRRKPAVPSAAKRSLRHSAVAVCRSRRSGAGLGAAAVTTAWAVGRGGGTTGRRVAITDLSATIIHLLILINYLVFAIFMQVYQLLADVHFGVVVDGKLLIKLA